MAVGCERRVREEEVLQGGDWHYAVIAECCDLIVLSQLPTVGGGKGGAVVRAGRLGRVTAGGRSPGGWWVAGAGVEGGGWRVQGCGGVVVYPAG